MDTVNLELACAAGDPPGFHSFPCQSIKGDEEERNEGSFPSHHGVLDGARATFVKIVFFLIVSIRFGFVFVLVCGATQKNPASGFMAHNRPSWSKCNQAMSSPTIIILNRL